MKIDLNELFGAPQILSANPHFYDYIHFIDLKQGGDAELVSGGGQALHRCLLGRCEVRVEDAEHVLLRFVDLRDVNPYDRTKLIKTYDTFEVSGQVERGPFALSCDIPANIAPEEWPWVLFDFRLALDADPLSIGLQPLPPELADYPETRPLWEKVQATQESERRYYFRSTGADLVYREIKARGLAGPPSS